jgi:hypothetical protein
VENLKRFFCALVLLPLLFACPAQASENENKPTNVKDSLIIVWSSGDRDVALKMVFMYAFNAQKRNWWNSVILIVWGPSSKLLANDPELQKKIKEMRDIGVRLEACKACADEYGVTGALQSLGIDVKYMGLPLTNYIKEGYPILTF